LPKCVLFFATGFVINMGCVTQVVVTSAAARRGGNLAVKQQVCAKVPATLLSMEI
jgi:hypothetical protein